MYEITAFLGVQNIVLVGTFVLKLFNKSIHGIIIDKLFNAKLFILPFIGTDLFTSTTLFQVIL